MSPAPVLTIAIPTYDRNGLLARHLPLLLVQLTSVVRVLIIDNASPTPVSSTLGSLPDGVRLVRNPVNLGGNANILRCFELCETPWIMVMGDDDRPLPDMIERILCDIAANPEAAILHYASLNMHVREKDWLTRGRLEFLARLDDFSNLLFISSSVLHLAQLRPGFSWAYHYAYSCAPHLALLLAAMDSASVAAFQSTSLVEWKLPDVENRGSLTPVALGLPTLLELPLTRAERWLLARHLARYLTAGTLLHQALVDVLFGGRMRVEAIRQFLHALHRLPFRYAPLRLLLGWYMAFGILLMPGMTYAIVGRVHRALTSRQMGGNNLRVDRL